MFSKGLKLETDTPFILWQFDHSDCSTTVLAASVDAFLPFRSD